jgi:hypothetical protein
MLTIETRQPGKREPVLRVLHAALQLTAFALILTGCALVVWYHARFRQWPMQPREHVLEYLGPYLRWSLVYAGVTAANLLALRKVNAAVQERNWT